MKLISVNVSLPRVVMSRGDSASTGIFKEPVARRVIVRTLNLDGDRQADLSVHVDQARQFTLTLPSTTNTGSANFLK
jgi:MOSC domain-containing protein YiiM